MMDRIFNMDNKFFTFMGKAADLILLNIIFLICCLPVVTIGASVTAMYYVTLKMVRNDESYISRSFFQSFRQNFRQATGIWLILLAVLCFILLIYGMISAYIFPLLAKFDNTVKNTFKNSLLMSIRHLPYTILLLLITYVPMFLTLNYGVVLVYGAVVWLAAGFALTAFINSHIYMRIYKNYILEEAQENDSEWTLGE